MAVSVKEIYRLIKTSFQEFSEDNCTTMASSLAYYTIFSLPPLLLIVITLCGFIWSPEDVQGAVREQMASIIGPQGADAVRTMLQNANQPGQGIMAGILGIIALLLGATGALVQLQSTLDSTWEVEPDPEQGGIKRFIKKRLFSFGMILVFAFLLLVSLLLTTALAQMGALLQNLLPGAFSAGLVMVLHNVVSFVVITLLFAAMYKVLPDARISWNDVWMGAIVTAALFVIGKFLLGFYLGRMDVSAYGAAAAIILVLVWIYYAALIFFFGAEFTQVWARRHGKTIEPSEGAVRIVKEKRHIRGDRSEQTAGTSTAT